ncbi:MAG: tetratricopeptide repeat protein [Chlamydiae bacterium]|nr:tetratricopeptide repeat protein [Chlamydiota bacterium]
MLEQEERLKRTLRKLGQNIEHHSMMAPQDFTQEDISLLYSLGVNLYEQGDYSQAKLIFERLILAKSHEKKFWMALGATLQMSRQYQEALTSWAMASFMEEDDPLPHFHACECLLSLEDYKEAKKALAEAKRRSSEDVELSKKIQALETAWNLES